MVEAEGIDGVRRLYAFTPLDGSAHSTILYTGIPTRTVYAGANRSLIRNLIAFGLVTVLVLAAAYLFGDLVVMRRVNALMGTAARLAEGDLGARTGIPSGSNELKQLGSAFDAMAESLDKKTNELEIRVEQRTEDLAKANERLRQSAEKLKIFAYSVAHDLKSPAIGTYGVERRIFRKARDSLHWLVGA